MLARKTPLKRTAFRSKPAVFGAVRATIEQKTEGQPKPPKARKCAVKSCRKQFMPDKPFVIWCSEDCGAEIAQVKLAKAKAAQSAAAKRAKKAERAQDKAKREEQKTLPELLAEAQTAFNRARNLECADLPCISCGSTSYAQGLRGGRRDCGHFRSVGSAGHLRYTPDNAWPQCKYCNHRLAGNHVNYRIGLVARIGLDRVEALENNNAVHKWTKDEVRAIRDQYRIKANQLSKELK